LPDDADRAMNEKNAWEQILSRLEAELSTEDFRHWLGATAYASDSGNQITVWVPSEAIRRHIDSHYRESIGRALASLGRTDTHVRLVVAGFGETDEDEEQ
jgi:chromosomal replication initiation ATPase DnaA